MISDRALWQRARTLFDDLVELSPDAQQHRLEDIGRNDPELRTAVEGLLTADRSADTALHDYSFGSGPASHPTAPHANSRDPLGIVGRRVSHFLVTDFLAAGGMGVVYAAEDLQLGRAVALKFPLPHQTVDRRTEERFVNEAKSAGSLDHPNLCTVHEIGQSEHGLFLAMPLYPGETLRDRLAREGALTPAVAVEIVHQVVSGLASAHAAGIVHRDLKPGNVMLLPDGTVKVLDFGLAKMRDVDLTKSRAALGTVAYVAPEQIRGEATDARADLWAIGVMLHEMLTGAQPFEGEHEISLLHAVLNDEPRQPSLVNTAVPKPYDDVVGTLLQKDPADRYSSADALLGDLAALRAGIPLSVRRGRLHRAARRYGARKGMLVGAAFLLVAAVTAAWGAYRLALQPGDVDSAVPPVPSLRWVNNVTEVGTTRELIAAIVTSNAGRHVRLRAGIYEIDRPLVVPDGMTLEGAGVMRFAADGLPEGFTDDTRTTLRMTASTGGDILTLGDDVTVRNIQVMELDGRSGNVIGIASRRPGDRITATISEVVIVNPNPLTITASGAVGRGLWITTRNPNMAADPGPDSGSTIDVRLSRSLITSSGGGGGLFVYNFAPASRISLMASRNTIGGSSEANGGVSRPDMVHDSEVHIVSEGNLYRNEWADPCVAAERGWNLTGGSGAPIPIPLPRTARNRLTVRSTSDRIEGFTTGIHATGSRRFFAAPLNEPPARNRIDLLLTGTTIATPTCSGAIRGGEVSAASSLPFPVADVSLTGAWVASNTFSAGDSNVVRAEFRGVTGSGARGNRFSHVEAGAGALPPGLRGHGNRLEIVGDAATFARGNRRVDPSPAPAHFIGPSTIAKSSPSPGREPFGSWTTKDRANPH